MSEAFIGEIRAFGFNFAPRGWAVCNGQLLPISQNTALFSILGTTYGGDGRTTFGLPDLQGRVPLQAGQGPGLQNYQLGETGGAASVTLTQAQMPQHSHAPQANSEAGDQASPANNVWAKAGAGRDQKMYAAAAGTGAALKPQAIAAAGGGQPHNNLPPVLVINYCIALQGVFPPRS